LEKKQERRKKAERAKKQWGTSFKREPWRGTTVTMAMTPSLAKKTRGLLTVSSSRTYPNGRSEENKCSDGVS